MLDKVINTQVGGFTLGRILMGIVIFIVCAAVSKLLLKLFKKASLKKGNPNIRPFVSTALRILLYVGSLLIALEIIGIPITTFVAVISVAGLALSLALQDSLSNVASGILLLSAKPFVVGDTVTVGSASGTVLSTSLLYTKIRGSDNKIILVPNKMVAAGEITNFSSEPMRRVDLTITASYATDTSLVKESLKRAVSRTPGVSETPKEPFINISGFAERSISYSVRVWCKNEDFWDVHNRLYEEVRAAFAEDKIKPVDRIVLDADIC